MGIQRDDWPRAAVRAFRRGGVDAVHVEALARELGVTKGSFYWHFTDRGELLDALLRLWEDETELLIEAAMQRDEPLERVLRFFELVARGRGQLPDTEYFAWARRDGRVAARTTATEERRVRFIRDQLRAAGLDEAAAARHAEAGYLATLGWIERASRRKDTAADFRSFTDHLFRWLFDGVRSPRDVRRAAARLAARPR
jgi:AcrR family transcriptional regulator